MHAHKFIKIKLLLLSCSLLMLIYACREEQRVSVLPFANSIAGIEGIDILQEPVRVTLNRNDIRLSLKLNKTTLTGNLDSLYLFLTDEGNNIVPEIKPMVLSKRELQKLTSQRAGKIQVEFKGKIITPVDKRLSLEDKYKILQSAKKFTLSTRLDGRVATANSVPSQSNASPPAFQVGNIPELVKYAKPAVFLVYSYAYGQSGGSQGTGFFISPDGIGVSNHHVFKGGNIQYVKTADNQQFDVTEILAQSAEYDYVIFRVEPTTIPFRYLKITETPPQEGEEIIVLGNPRGLEGTVTKGIVSALRDPLIQFDAAISPGSSGSPVLNLKGEVLGIATLKLNGCENCNMAFDINTVLNDIRLQN